MIQPDEPVSIKAFKFRLLFNFSPYRISTIGLVDTCFDLGFLLLTWLRKLDKILRSLRLGDESLGSSFSQGNVFLNAFQYSRHNFSLGSSSLLPDVMTICHAIAEGNNSFACDEGYFLKIVGLEYFQCASAM
jgi:hypothetical protein